VHFRAPLPESLGELFVNTGGIYLLFNFGDLSGCLRRPPRGCRVAKPHS
jgi:hypothetical protein